MKREVRPFDYLKRLLFQDCENYYDAREGHCAVWNEMRIREGEHDWKPYQAKKGEGLVLVLCLLLLVSVCFVVHLYEEGV